MPDMNNRRDIRNRRGDKVPVVTFYSIQGGVGKSTLAEKFAELVTCAPGMGGIKPNVLLIDLDVESEGLTYRLSQSGHRGRTVHEVIAQRNITNIVASDVTVQMDSAYGRSHGHLYLMPAAPPNATEIFQVLANIDPDELYGLMQQMIESLVEQYDISCVVIDCYPGAYPYSAAAATLADIPMYIGRNEETSYVGINRLPERFKEWYPNFGTINRQTVIINAVTVKETLDQRIKHYQVDDFIPFTIDLVLETEGLSRTKSYQMMLLDKYLIEVMKKVLIGWNHLIPEDVLPDDWWIALEKFEHVEAAPKMKHLHSSSHLRWVGIPLAVVGIGLLAAHGVFGSSSSSTVAMNIGIACLILGIASSAVGWYCRYAYKRIIQKAKDLVDGGPQVIMKKLNEGRTARKELDEMLKLADTIK